MRVVVGGRRVVDEIHRVERFWKERLLWHGVGMLRGLQRFLLLAAVNVLRSGGLDDAAGCYFHRCVLQNLRDDVRELLHLRLLLLE